LKHGLGAPEIYSAPTELTKYLVARSYKHFALRDRAEENLAQETKVKPLLRIEHSGRT